MLNTTRSTLTALLVVAALVCLAGELMGQRGLVYVTKPAATFLILLIALAGQPPVSGRYRTLIATGLVLSLAGDVLLMLPGDRFVPGLASFLVAHLCYIAAFAGAGGGLRGPRAAFGVAAVGAIMLVTLWPGLGDVWIPVVIYVVAIATMAWQAIARWQNGPGEGAGFAAAGALLFMVSDGALAIHRFAGDFPGATVLVLGTYWVAQFLIARSVLRSPRTLTTS